MGSEARTEEPPAAGRAGPPSPGGEAAPGVRSWIADGASQRLGARAAEPEALLGELSAARPAAWMRRIPKRETFAWPDAGAALVAKRFVGDPEGARWRALAWWTPRRSPARREAENLRALRAAGFPVPRAIAWLEDSDPAGRSALLMERVPHEANLREAVERAPRDAARAWLRPLAELVARLHAAGWYHRDLYLHHFVLASEPGSPLQLALLDLGRARNERSPRRRWFVKDLAALQLSTPAAVAARTRLRFVVEYARARGLSSAQARGLACHALHKARRMAAHTPRHVDPHDALRGSGA